MKNDGCCLTCVITVVHARGRFRRELWVRTLNERKSQRSTSFSITSIQPKYWLRERIKKTPIRSDLGLPASKHIASSDNVFNFPLTANLGRKTRNPHYSGGGITVLHRVGEYSLQPFYTKIKIKIKWNKFQQTCNFLNALNCYYTYSQ